MILVENKQEFLNKLKEEVDRNHGGCSDMVWIYLVLDTPAIEKLYGPFDKSEAFDMTDNLEKEGFFNYKLLNDYEASDLPVSDTLEILTFPTDDDATETITESTSVKDDESRKIVFINTGRECYSAEDVLDTFTVGDLKFELENCDDDLPVYFSNDRGYTYGEVYNPGFSSNGGWEESGQYLIIEVPHTGYGPDQCNNTYTVREFIDELNDFDDDYKVILSFQNGYTYGGITADNISIDDWQGDRYDSDNEVSYVDLDESLSNVTRDKVLNYICEIMTSDEEVYKDLDILDIYTVTDIDLELTDGITIEFDAKDRPEVDFGLSGKDGVFKWRFDKNIARKFYRLFGYNTPEEMLKLEPREYKDFNTLCTKNTFMQYLILEKSNYSDIVDNVERILKYDDIDSTELDESNIGYNSDDRVGIEIAKFIESLYNKYGYDYKTTYAKLYHLIRIGNTIELDAETGFGPDKFTFNSDGSIVHSFNTSVGIEEKVYNSLPDAVAGSALLSLIRNMPNYWTNIVDTVQNLMNNSTGQEDSTNLDEAKKSNVEYLYLFPEELDENIIRYAEKYFNLEYLGRTYYSVDFNGQPIEHSDDYNWVVKGTKTNLKKFAKALDYDLHPDFLFKADEFTGEIEQMNDPVNLDEAVSKNRIGNKLAEYLAYLLKTRCTQDDYEIIDVYDDELYIKDTYDNVERFTFNPDGSVHHVFQNDAGNGSFTDSADYEDVEQAIDYASFLTPIEWLNDYESEIVPQIDKILHPDKYVSDNTDLDEGIIKSPDATTIKMDNETLYQVLEDWYYDDAAYILSEDYDTDNFTSELVNFPDNYYTDKDSTLVKGDIVQPILVDLAKKDIINGENSFIIKKNMILKFRTNNYAGYFQIVNEPLVKDWDFYFSDLSDLKLIEYKPNDYNTDNTNLDEAYPGWQYAKWAKEASDKRNAKIAAYTDADKNQKTKALTKNQLAAIKMSGLNEREVHDLEQIGKVALTQEEFDKLSRWIRAANQRKNSDDLYGDYYEIRKICKKILHDYYNKEDDTNLEESKNNNIYYISPTITDYYDILNSVIGWVVDHDEEFIEDFCDAIGLDFYDGYNEINIKFDTIEEYQEILKNMYEWANENQTRLECFIYATRLQSKYNISLATALDLYERFMTYGEDEKDSTDLEESRKRKKRRKGHVHISADIPGDIAFFNKAASPKEPEEGSETTEGSIDSSTSTGE